MVRRAAMIALSATASCSLFDARADAARISVTGRAERGLELQVVAMLGSRAVPADSVQITLTPPDAATVSTAGVVSLVKVGPLGISARFPDGQSAAASVSVAQPPTIVFDMVVAGNRDIYSVSLDGQDLVRLTTDPADDADPSSVSGRLVFTSYRTGNAELFARSSAGDVTQLTSSAGAESQAVLSPNGLKLAFVRDDGARRVWIASEAGTGQTLLTANYGSAAMTEAAPTWSPASDSIAFVSTAPGAASIYTAAGLPGVTPSLLVSAVGDSSRVEPAWSASVHSIAFVSGSVTSQVFVLNRANGSRTLASQSPEPAGQPAWLADGRIVFTQFVSGQGRLRWVDPVVPGVIHAIPVSGSDAQRAAAVLP